MKGLLARLKPDGLAARFAILLVLALLGANLIAAFLLAREGTSFDRAMRLQGDAHRLAALVEALEHADPATALSLPQRSSTGFTRFSVEPGPLEMPHTRRLPDHEAQLMLNVPDRAIEIHEAGPPRGGQDRAALLLVSVRLQKGFLAGHWLNALAYPLPSRQAWKWKMGFFVPLAASLLGTLIVGGIFIRRMTLPLSDLAEAARAAGRGERKARVAERGASEIRKAAAAFNDMQRRIAGFETDRLRLLAAVGHDLRTPITGLRIRAELLDDEEQREGMIRVLDEMAVMAEELLHAAGTGSPGEDAQDSDLDRMLAQLCADRGIDYSPTAPLHLAVRPVAMRRAIGNILDNALRYAGAPLVRLSCDHASALIRIEDGGPGIPERILDQICEPFIRGEGSRSTETGGVGLGLSIARDVIRHHGGSLSLRNRSQGGLSVEIHLPTTPSRQAGCDGHQFLPV
ncbi:ATP-binding protein [Paracoccus sp. MBLB3053]|uniref:histidine kinase n=1 Tax=Paracoccus aurantius TaxID=3073814 RepID=A0ABU2HVT0_9RHOB|nr:ATP-binding protein [Paracoccus sp. MBLB3053]MDS9468842.1 ATP-binding protein [Paracoccus sp. MBLB3053]